MTAPKRKPQPITAHPMFPFVTGLWMATGLGLGSFVMAPALLEGPVVALGIPALVPAAAPPLGFTARALVALIMLIVGAVAGYAIGRRIGRPRAATPAPVRGAAEGAGRRRALLEREAEREAVTESDAGNPVADAPRHAIMAAEDLGVPLDAPFEAEVLSSQDADTADLADDFTDAQVEPEAAPLVLEAAISDSDEPVTVEALELVAGLQPAADRPSASAAADLSPILQANAAAATPLARSPLESLGLVQLVERLALAMSERSRRNSAVAASQPDLVAPQAALETAEPSPVQQQAVPLPRLFGHAPEGLEAGGQDLAMPEPAPMADVQIPSSWQHADNDRVVSLRPAMVTPIVFPADVPETGDDAEAVDLPRFLRMPATPDAEADEAISADQDFSDAEDIYDEVEDEDETFGADLPEFERPEPDVNEQRYSSLLGMTPTGPRREALRIDDGLACEYVDADSVEPVVVFPGQGAEALSDGPADMPEAEAAMPRPFDNPAITPIAGSPLAARGRAAPSARIESLEMPDLSGPVGELPAEVAAQPADADEADRALRAALATLQRMTAQG